MISNYGFSLGASDGSSQYANWTAALDSATAAGAGGCAYGVADAAIFMAEPSATLGGITEHGRLGFAGFSPGTMTGTWSHVDGADRQVLYVVLSVETDPAPTRIAATRRVRIFPLPVSESNKRMVLHSLEFLLQVGMGKTTGQGVDPKIMVQVSRDYGKTWSPERWVSAGKKGEFDRRVILRQLGQFRSGGYVKLAVTDPVQWTFLQAMGDLVEGTS
jgi:hypothetical protein